MGGGTGDFFRRSESPLSAHFLALAAKHQKVEELNRDPHFTQLSADEQKALLEQIETRLDAANTAALRETKKS